MNISKPKRQFVDTKLVVDSWESIEGYYNNLIQREINSKEDFIYWLRDQSELEAILEEDAAWRYIKMTIDTKDEVLSNAYTFFVANIQPKIAPMEDQLNRKLYASKYIDEADRLGADIEPDQPSARGQRCTVFRCVRGDHLPRNAATLRSASARRFAQNSG